MPSPCVYVRAPSRLHFGMLSFGDATVRQYGGAGVMADTPGLEVTVSLSDQLAVAGRHAERATSYVRCWASYRRVPWPPACRVHVTAAPRMHIGLGTGTQLALSVAAGLDALWGLPPAPPDELARSVGRGKRSAVGTYGFCHGGLIAELGKRTDQPLAPLARRIALPSAWRLVLLMPTGQTGLSGQAEEHAFDRMTPVPRQITEQLLDEMNQRLLPSAARADFDALGESIYRYGVTAGQCFAQHQAGAFATQQSHQWVQFIRQLGVAAWDKVRGAPRSLRCLPARAMRRISSGNCEGASRRQTGS